MEQNHYFQKKILLLKPTDLELFILQNHSM